MNDNFENIGKYMVVSFCKEDYAIIKEDLDALQENNVHLWYLDTENREENWEIKFSKAITNINCKGAIIFNSAESFIDEDCHKERKIIIDRHDDFSIFRYYAVNIGAKDYQKLIADAFNLATSKKVGFLDYIEEIKKMSNDNVFCFSRKDSKQCVQRIIKDIAKPNLIVYDKAGIEEEFDDVHTKFDAYTGSEPYLFVSYSHRDCATVYHVLDILYDHKYRLWYDESCETGNDFRDELRRRIENSSAVLLFVSKQSMASPFCGMEIIVARENGKKLYPIYLDDTAVPPAFEMLLANTHHGTVSDIDKLIKSLIRDLPAETMDRLTIENGYLKKCEDNGESIVVQEGIRVICQDAFKERKALHFIDLPESLETIEAESFRGCSNLEKIDIPDRTSKIGESAFRDCVNVKSLILRNPRIKINERAFENCATLSYIELPDGLMEIYGGVFNSCKALKTIRLPSQLTIIGENAFSDCVGLEKIELPSTLTKIDDLAFNGCLSLKSIELGTGVKKIGKSAFKNCKSLTNISIPVSVTCISEAPFRGCENLKSIKVDSKNKYFKSEPNKREGQDLVLFNKNKSTIIAYPSASKEVQYDIPDSVTIISEWAFSESKKLNRVTIPDSVYEIREGAFCNCTLLDEIEIPDSVTKIDDCAFRGCTNLEKIIVPDSVTEIGWGVFDGCEERIVVYCNEGSEIQKYCRLVGVRETRMEKTEK